MFSTLIAAVVALVLGHLAQPLAASVRHYGWFADWLRWLDRSFPEVSFWRTQWGFAVALLPPVLGVLLFQLALTEPLYGLVGLAFGIAVLFYTWGPRDLDVDVDAVMDARDPVTRRAAAARLWPHGASPSLNGSALVEAVFRNAQRRWFGVLLWFLLLGPCGALLYRLTARAVEDESGSALPAENASGARLLLALLDWPVAQLMTLALAVVGNFDTVLNAWREAGGASFNLKRRFLGAVARASVRSELAEEVADYASEPGVPLPPSVVLGELPELRDAMSLIWRSLLVWLAVLAMFVIAGWVS